MTREELIYITPREFFNRINGYQEQQNFEAERERNLITAIRSHAFLTLSPHFKKDARTTPQDLWPLPWDIKIEEAKKSKSEQLRIKMLRNLQEKGQLPPHMEKWLEENDI